MDDQQIEALKIELSKPVYKGLSNVEAYDLLHKPQRIVNKTIVLKPLTINDMLAAMSPESLKTLIDWPHLTDLRDKIVSDDRAGVGLWGQLLVAGGKITGDEYAAVQKQLEATMEVETIIELLPRILSVFAGVKGMPNLIEPDVFAKVFGS